MGPRDELERRLATDGIHGNPEAAILPAADVVVRLILVPGRALPRAGLLGQHMIVVEPCPGAAHRSCSDLAERRSEDELPIALVVLPAPEVLEKEAGIAGSARDLRPGAGMRQILVDSRPEELDLVLLEKLPQHHSAVGVEGIHLSLRDPQALAVLRRHSRLRPRPA